MVSLPYFVVFCSKFQACHKGTVASKKKKNPQLYSTISKMHIDFRIPFCLQGFAEKLIFRLQTCNECFEVIMRS
ncbi:hypothetical protein POTOM_035530 [Populus tomentosa]|uniref:Uncharacterized protein n=1 Tax=Populus tomentosa TaxID=118781 RepID=A0A8X7Z2T6_POPTO|nr:hypothetical protein POTOM_035530 [Populus tomentosa]